VSHGQFVACHLPDFYTAAQKPGEKIMRRDVAADLDILAISIV
jgi:hypothetical protein